MSRRTLLVLAIFFCLLTAFSGLALGQDVTASIVGTVTDPSGAPIKGADIAATDRDRGAVWTAKTDDTGAYSLLRLPTGNYTVKVTAAGFQTANHAPFTLVLNQAAKIDVQMKVGQVNETVEVAGGTPILQTESPEVSTILSPEAVTSVPLAGRNYLQLGLLAPGTTTNNPSAINEPHNLDGNGRPFINGNREQANQYFLDGILNSEDKNNETSFMPNVDAIGDFNIITQNASAEFGDYEGGIVSVSTKGGTNRFHGSVYEFFRNDKLDANLPSNGWSQGVAADMNTPGHVIPGHAADGTILKPEFRYNQFGVTLGGPIIKDKLFFFVDYQGLRDLNAGATGAQLLTQRMRSGDFGQICASGFNGSGICQDAGTDSLGNGIALNQLVVPNSGGPVAANCAATATMYYLNPAQRPACGGTNPTPIASNVMANAGFTIGTVANNLFTQYGKYYPLPQVDSVAAGNNYFYNSGTALNNDQGDVRIDYNRSDKDRFFLRYSQGHLRNPAFSGCLFCAAGSALGADQPMKNAVVNWTHTFSGTLLNEARLGFNAVQFNQNVTQTAFLGDVGQTLGINNGNFESPGLLNINIPAFVSPTGVGAPSADLGNSNLFQIFHTTQGQFNDNLSIIRGRHSLKTGFQFIRQRQDFDYAGNNGGLGNIPVSTASGAGLSDFWLGLAATGGVRDTYLQPALFKHRGNIYAGYIQDDWRATSTLTLNLGLRFEDHTPLSEVENRMVNFGLYTGTIYTPDGRDGTQKFSNAGLSNNYLGKGDWEPRFGFAWSPAALGRKTVIRGGYAISAFMEGGGTNEQLTMNPPLGIFAMGNAGGTIAAGYGTPTNCSTINLACFAGTTSNPAPTRIRVTDQNFKPAQSQQWNLTLQHQFGNTLTAQIGYVGQHGTHLLNFEDLGQRVGLNAAGQIAKPGQAIVSQRAGPYLGGGNIPCDTTSVPATCGTVGSLYQLEQGTVYSPATATAPATYVSGGALLGANMSNSSQSYNALQAVLQKRMGGGLEAQVAYTYSKCLSNSPGYFGTGWGSTGATSSGGQPGPQNIYDPRSDWGPCFFNQTHVLSSYADYQLPVGKGKQYGKDMNPALNAILGNWEIGAIVSTHSGNSLTLNAFGGWGSFAGDVSGTNGIGPATLSERPDCAGPVHIANKKIPGTATSPAGYQWIDPTGISNPTVNALGQGHFGTCSVGNVSGPKFFDADLSLHKNFQIAEGKSLQFRFEALNAFNNAVWTFSGGPADGSFDPGSPIFGQITGSQSARSVQLGLKFIY
ncbi:MAG TPA: carboxypeptidase regulatory-like domain-containing protein [Terriglobales bacterium]|jgi:hypothetical protein|nr:carboxypeptidase regulatory-like domain-containing protein [Terriglobales bacterium]